MRNIATQLKKKNMKKTLQSILVIFFASLVLNLTGQTRYLDDVFTNVNVTSDIVYANNISILPVLQGLPPAAMDLTFDLYEPDGDTISNDQ